jgi:polar amino acid transport system substrate-binding protein
MSAELTPGGRLRVGVNLSNFLLVAKQPDGSLKGIVPDLAAELGRRLRAPVEFVHYAGPGQLADAAGSGAWDVGFLGAEPQRAAVIAFSDAYLEIPATYLVPAGSPIGSIDQVDRPGVRIATMAKSAYELWLSRNIRQATLVRAETIPATFELFKAQKLEVLSGLLPRLVTDVEQLPGARILEGRFTAVQQAIGTPKARTAGAAYLQAFATEMRSAGFVADAIRRHGVKGVAVPSGSS